MRIVQISTTVVGAPWRELTFVELRTDTGHVGVGEVRMVNKTETLLACIDELGSRYVVGASPFDVERIAWGVDWTEYGRAGEVAQSALSAFDVACWDLIGQAVGQPVWKLIGGEFRSRVPAYANGWYQGERIPEQIAARAATVVDRGYRGLKLDPFSAASGELTNAQLTDAVEIVAAVRDAIGPDTALMIEAHGRFRSSTATRISQELAPFDPEWIEEPVPPANVHGLRNVRASTTLPIATGERVHTMEDVAPLLEEGLVDVLQIDLTHFGGITALRKAASWAAAYNVPIAPHNVCGPVGTAANVHLGISVPNFKVLEHFNDFADPWVQQIVDEAPTVDQLTGAFSRPDRPGLGVTLNHDVCAEHPANGATMNLFAVGWEQRQGTALGR